METQKPRVWPNEDSEGPHYVEVIPGMTLEEARKYFNQNYGYDDPNFYTDVDAVEQVEFKHRDDCSIMDEFVDKPPCPCPVCPIEKSVTVWKLWLVETAPAPEEPLAVPEIDDTEII